MMVLVGDGTDGASGWVGGLWWLYGWVVVVVWVGCGGCVGGLWWLCGWVVVVGWVGCGSWMGGLW